MAPGGKRKRPDRPPSDGGRPSPHRPGDTALGQHDRDDGGRNRNRRGGRGGSHRRDSSSSQGRGGMSTPNSQQPLSPTQRRPSSTAQPNTMAPPPTAPAVPSAPTSQVQPVPSPTVDSPSKPALPRVPYRYDNITDERLQDWAGHGRAEIVTYAKQSRDD